ncbi:MAG: gliding motility-associated C-terminal domain-containing protein [Duncaniella sp.]|nr:gliding motility-associated C-terminal domain-containing protein [Duncaniella sp.]
MKRVATILMVMIPMCWVSAEVLSWSGCEMEVLRADAEKQSGLDAVYVADGLDGVTLTYHSRVDGPAVKWYVYSSMGAGYMQELTDVLHIGEKWEIASVRGDSGYVIEDGDERYVFWVVDYSAHRLSLSSLEAGRVECDRVELTVRGEGDEIAYYGVNGGKFVLSREIDFRYNTLVYDEECGCYRESVMDKRLDYVEPMIYAESPLCVTEYEMSGDRFLAAWGGSEKVRSAFVAPKSVSARTEAVQIDEDVTNRVKEEPAGGLGGSAPCEIEFSAVVTDGVAFTEWQMSATPDFDDINVRVRETDFTYTFMEEGTWYVRFMCADDTGECEWFGETYTVNVGASMLKCPNAFSPGNGDGVNDEWRVSYKSITRFNCTIYDRHGHKMATLNDPAEGWNSRYRGKPVGAGVYYYVINAEGADGKRYELSGDINIVNYK